jgi:Calcineurin-like phosphoesterase
MDKVEKDDTFTNKKSMHELVGLKRKGFINNYKSYKYVKNNTHKPPSKKLWEFLSAMVIRWLISTILHTRSPYRQYKFYDSTEDRGIYPLKSFDEGDLIKVAILGDWATNTDESDFIGDQVSQKSPDYSIHLGDTYYTGIKEEIESNFGEGSYWPEANCGNFALLGNHEMYSSGDAYFTSLLPLMGFKKGNEIIKQKASFLCLENKYWRIICLDTGYDSLTKNFLGLYVKDNLLLKLNDMQLDWLRKNVFTSSLDKRGIIFLSHHQYFSAFDSKNNEYTIPAVQLYEFIDKDTPVLWLWGHEHRFSVYGCFQHTGGIKSFGRCIGHSGMPIEIIKDGEIKNINNDRKLVIFDNRERCTLDETKIGHNGYALLLFENEKLSIEYYDENDKILSEIWKIDIDTGLLEGIEIEEYTSGKYPSEPADYKTKLFHYVPDLRDAIRI